MKPLSGTFYRIAFAQYAEQVLDGVIHPEGRFHHNGQPALYASPSPETAAIAIDIYLKHNDAARVMIPLAIDNAKMADLRDPDTCARLGIDPASHGPINGPPENPQPVGKLSDIVRDSGADGMIYASRRAPERWHIVLFRWNQPNAAMVGLGGPHSPWVPG
jgi:RES domain-containing protein